MGCNTFNYNLNHNGYPYKTISVKAFNWYFVRKELCEAEEEGIRNIWLVLTLLVYRSPLLYMFHYAGFISHTFQNN